MTDATRDRSPNVFHRRRISLALALLGAIAAIQGVFAIWALGETERHVLRGRVAADIKLGFRELISDKQLLRNWVAQRHFRAGDNIEQRDALLTNIVRRLPGSKIRQTC